MTDQAKSSDHGYCFGPFRLDASRQLLFKEDQPVTLASRFVRALVLLVQNHGKDLEKSYLMDQLWPGTAVEESNLAVIISTLRKALGETPEHHKYIITIPGKGYRFVARVTETGNHSFERSEKPFVSSVGHQFGPQVKGIAVVGSMLLFVLLSIWGVRVWKDKEADSIQTLAVLPFRPLGSETDDEYLALGMADALITRLREVRHISVRPTNDVLKYRDAVYNPRAIGQTLNVASLLDGTIEKNGDNVSLRVRLLRVRDGTILWSQEYQGKFAGIFAMQDQIAERTARALTLKVNGVQSNPRKHYPSSAEAYQLYLRGEYYCNTRNLQTIDQAIGYFQQAVEKDATFAVAYAGLSYCYLHLIYDVNPQNLPTDTFSKAEEAAKEALKLDDSLAQASLVSAVIKTHHDWDFPGAEAAYRRALEVTPDDAEVHEWYAWHLIAMGRSSEALHEIQRARELDPSSLMANSHVGIMDLYARRYKEAAQQLQGIVDVEPEVMWNLIWLCYMQRQPIPAVEKLEDTIRGNPESCGSSSELPYLYALKGMKREANRCLQHMQLKNSAAYYVALVYSSRGNKDEAFRWLELARQERSWDILYLKVDPLVDDLRSDPRFNTLLREVGLVH